MKKGKVRKSITSILIKRIFLAIVAFNLILGAYFIFDEIESEKHRKEERALKLTSQIDSMLLLIDLFVDDIETEYNLMQQKILENVTKNIVNKKITEVRINEILLAENFDTAAHEIDIVVGDYIVNSNNKKYIGQNIFENLNPTDSIYFQKQISRDVQMPVHFFYDKDKDNYIAFSILPNKKDGYEAIIHSIANEFNIITGFLKFKLREMLSETPSLLSVNFWLYLDEQRIPLLADPMNNLVASMITDSISKQDSVMINFRQDDHQIGIKHIYWESDGSVYNFEGISISIVTDFTNETDAIQNIIISRVWQLAVILFVVLLIIYFATRSLKLTLADLLKKTHKIGKGRLNERVEVIGNTEFTTLAEQFNEMIDKVENAHNELKDKNEEILRQRDEIEAQHKMTVEQKQIIEKQQKQILDSINYASKIQEAVLPDNQIIKDMLPDSVIYFKPRSIVSGDFYWVKKLDDSLIIVAADCTGHGVPGAFMSMLGIGLLNEIILHDRGLQPNEVLNLLRDKIKYALNQTGKDFETQDGMDMTICKIDMHNRKIQFAAAMNSLILIRDNEIIEFDADEMPVGVYVKDNKSFTHKEIEIKENDVFYMYSDGYADQIGGPKNRKFMSSNFKKLLLETSSLPFNQQFEKFDNIFLDWIKDYKQIDDVLVLGFKII